MLKSIKPVIRQLKLLSLVAATLVAFGQSANADTLLGLYADANYWHTSNDTKYQSVDADMDKKGQTMISASLEHGVPFVPNARVRYADLSTDGKYTTNISKYDLNSTDVIAYYEILDNIVSVDVGLGAKILDGNWQVNNTKVDLGETLPMLYASAGGKLPFTGFSAKAEAGIAKNSDVDVIDTLAEVQYDFIDNMAVDMGLKVGYRIMDIKYEDNKKNKLDGKFKGPYIGLQLHF